MSSHGVQHNWDVFPRTRLENAQLPTPLGCVYQPLAPRPAANDNPLAYCSCARCGAYISPYASVDLQSGTWRCPFCQQQLFLPVGADATRWPTNATAEQALPADVAHAAPAQQCMVWLIDQYQHIDDSSSFDTLVALLVEALDMLPDGTPLVMLLFTDAVHVHRLGATPVSIGPNAVFDGYQAASLFTAHTIDKVVGLLGGGTLAPTLAESVLTRQRIVSIVSAETRPLLRAYLQSLRPTFTNAFKPVRAMGLAVYVFAVMFARLLYCSAHAQVYAIMMGPNTAQPGQVVTAGSSLRLHHDIRQLDSGGSNAAARFFEAVSLVANGVPWDKSFDLANGRTGNTTEYDPQTLAPRFCFNVFAASLDQVGLYELQRLVLNTNGDVCLASAVGDLHFGAQWRQAMRRNDVANAATLTVLTSARLKIKSLLGHAYRLPSLYSTCEDHHDHILDQLGRFDSKFKRHHFTNRWFWNTFNPTDTLALQFEVDGLKLIAERGPDAMHIQFQFRYWHRQAREWRLRVVTDRHRTTQANKKLSVEHNLANARTNMLQGFNATAWVVLLCRTLIDKLHTDIGFDFAGVTALIDAATTKLLHNFGGLDERVRELVPMVYSLRRNPQLINIFNSLPDETTFYHHWLMKMDIAAASVAIQPRLYRVPGGAASLDATILDDTADGSFLVLDTVFSIVIYHQLRGGARLALHPSENSTLLNSAEVQPAMTFIRDRLLSRALAPRYIITQTGHSQARFLVSRLNPVAPATTVATGPWWRPFKTPVRCVMSDELSFEQYYAQVVAQVKSYRTEDDY